MHQAIEILARRMGLPDCTSMKEVPCCDCGRLIREAHASWTINLKSGKKTGPHCGCMTK